MEIELYYDAVLDGFNCQDLTNEQYLVISKKMAEIRQLTGLDILIQNFQINKIKNNHD